MCKAYGQRVQKSVFECVLAPEQVELLRHDLEKPSTGRKTASVSIGSVSRTADTPS
ncbi:MAG: CRISPR-associated endonuclease Cas2 [Chloroflexi bacterium]|nr:CRISPR-associated endonuclease Cas2 [Chloroflexota bacterium]